MEKFKEKINSYDIFTFSSLSDCKNIVHGISTRSFGSMKTRHQMNKANLNNFFTRLQIPFAQTIGMDQVHGEHVSLIDDIDATIISKTDGLLTSKKGIFLYTVTADCLPVVFYDPVQNIVGVAHAGYRGLIGESILGNMIRKFQKVGGDASSIKVAIGPGIGVCCYTVDKERLVLFKDMSEDYFEERDGQYFLDLRAVAVHRLLRHGVQRKNIEISLACTKDNLHMFYSYRGDSKETFGEFATVIGMI